MGHTFEYSLWLIICITTVNRNMLGGGGFWCVSGSRFWGVCVLPVCSLSLWKCRLHLAISIRCSVECVLKANFCIHVHLLRLGCGVCLPHRSSKQHCMLLSMFGVNLQFPPKVKVQQSLEPSWNVFRWQLICTSLIIL